MNSMSDLFHPDVPIGFIHQVFAVMADTPQHQYQVLTKRSKRLVALANELVWPDNVWMGVSIESQAYAFRADHLRKNPGCRPNALSRTPTWPGRTRSLGHRLGHRRG